MSVFGLALAAHLIADFPLQPDWMARRKTEELSVLTAHVAVHTAVLALFLFAFASLPLPELGRIVAGVSAVHAVVDYRRWWSPKKEWAQPLLWVWLNDQIAHIVSIAVIVELIL